MRSRWLYWCLFIVLASQGRFISLVLSDSLKFTDSQVGFILGMGVIASMAAVPYFSRKADGPMGCLKVEALLVGSHVAAFGALGLVGLIQDDTARFILAAISRFFSTGLIAPTSSILDAYTLRTLEDQNMYGRERLWGAISWALASIVMGLAMDIFNSPLYVSLCFLVLGSIWFFMLLRKMPDEREMVQAIGANAQPLEPKVGPTSPSLWRLWKGRPTIIVFLCVSLVMGAATSIVENLLFLFMRQDLKASYTLCGVSVVITVLFEIPLFFVGKNLLKSVGVLNLMLIGMFCYITRVVCYTLLEIPWTVLLVEPFHGLTYATIQTAAVSYIHSKCPKDRVAEGQGVYTLVRSVGQLLGTTIGSQVLETFGSAVMYRTSAIVVTIAAVVLVVVFKCVEDVDVMYDESLISREVNPQMAGSNSPMTNEVEAVDDDIEMRQIQPDDSLLKNKSSTAATALQAT